MIGRGRYDDFAIRPDPREPFNRKPPFPAKAGEGVFSGEKFGCIQILIYRAVSRNAKGSAKGTGTSSARKTLQIERPENAPVERFQRDGAGRPEEQGTGMAADAIQKPSPATEGSDSGEGGSPKGCRKRSFSWKRVRKPSIPPGDRPLPALRATFP